MEKLDIHVYLHSDKDSDSKLNKILRILENHLMPTLQEIQTQVAAVQASADAETTVDDSIVALLDGLTGMVADLKVQLDAAIASGNSAALQAVSDGLAAVQTTVDANKQKLADAVTNHTPAASV